LLQCNGKQISWGHLRSLYQRDSGKCTGLSLVPKLKSEHINLTAFSKMRVDLAAQVSAASLITLAHTWTLVILCVELVSLVNVSVITLLPTMVVTRYFDSRVEHGTCTTHDTPNGCGFCNYNEGE